VTPETYPHKQQPWKHQRELLEQTWDREYFALLWEQGTGKTKAALDTACLQYMNGLIDGLLIVAPDGVHLNWSNTEVPEHLPDALRRVTKTFAYQTKKAKNKSFKADIQKLLDHKGFAILCMSYSNFMTGDGKKWAKKFLTERTCMYTLDEASEIKNPGAARTKTLRASARYAKTRRILEGTPVTQAPFDIYAPMCFLHKAFWHDYNCADYDAFKQKHGIFQPITVNAGNRVVTVDKVVGYKQVDALREYLLPHVSRVLKKDVMDLPPKVFQKHRFEMSAEQWRVYNDLDKQQHAMLGDVQKCPECDGTGKVDAGDYWKACDACAGRGMVSDLNITAELPIVCMMRKQQVSAGYSPADEDPHLRLIGSTNVRLEELMKLVEKITGKVIIWSRFTADINLIMERFAKDGISAVRYDGQVDEDDREAAKVKFQKVAIKDGGPVAFVANPAAASRGLTLHAAKTVIYYNNSFKLRDRLQSEDRAHRGGMDEHPVLYIDMMSDAPIDETIVTALRNKQDVADQVTGDEAKEWI